MCAGRAFHERDASETLDLPWKNGELREQSAWSCLQTAGIDDPLLQ